MKGKDTNSIVQTISFPNMSNGNAACLRSRSLSRDRPRHGSFSSNAAPWHSLKNSLVCELQSGKYNIEHIEQTNSYNKSKHARESGIYAKCDF